MQSYLSARLECHVDGVRHNAVLRADCTSTLGREGKVETDQRSFSRNTVMESVKKSDVQVSCEID